MQFEVTDKCEEREGIIFKKPVYLARANIHLNDEEFDALQSMAKSKEWREYPIGEIQVTPKIRQTVTMSMCLAWAKKTKTFSKGIRTQLPEERELQVSEVREVAGNLKQVLQARLSALSASDEDVLEEI